MSTSKASSAVEDRLREEAKSFARPADRLATIDRLVAACDALEDGSATSAFREANSARRRHAPEKINPTNIDTYVRFMGWTGPTRTFLSNKKNGLIEYVRAREEERSIGNKKRAKRPETQEESYLDKIPDIEVRQFVRFEIERRRSLERELNILKNALKRIPRVDLSDLLEAGTPSSPALQSKKIDRFEPGVRAEKTIRELLRRMDDLENLRHLGLTAEGGDILALTGALVISAEELETLRALVGQEGY